MMSAHMMWRCGLHFGVTSWQVRQVLCAVQMPLHASWRMRGSQLLLCASVVVGVNVSGGLPNLSGCSSPRWLSVGSTLYRSWFVLVSVLSLTPCLMSNGGSGAQYVTRKSSKLGGELGMAAQVLHVTDQGQSVRVRMREGMRSRSLGRPSNGCGCGRDLQEAIVLVSLLFNKWGPLHIHNQQLHSLTVDHDFVDVNGYHWSLRATVLHIGATREEGHFVVHILVRDEWWLCDDASVTTGRPPANS